MRQALLVIVLVGAAFGGGAVVSGPGFRWAQESALNYMGLKDGGEIDTLDLTPTSGEGKPPVAEPLAGPAAAVANSTPSPTPTPTPPPAPEPKATEPYAEQAAGSTPAPPSPAPSATPAKAEAPALLGALGAMLSPPKAPAAKTAEATPPVDPAVKPSSLPALESVPEPPAAASASGDWAEIRRSLDAAGVSRYTIEGEPGGRVVFACLIPLAGKQAVSQRFEAEGEDEFQAARSVLKRINLWRASHAEADKP